jgi:hypothetical protein
MRRIVGIVLLSIRLRAEFARDVLLRWWPFWMVYDRDMARNVGPKWRP